jgi:hypothetical protein
VDWIGLDQDRDRWRALVNSGSIKMLGSYRVSKQLGIYRVVLSSMELVSYLVGYVPNAVKGGHELWSIELYVFMLY